MKLKDLIKNVEVKSTVNFSDVEIKSVKFDSNSVTENSLFICISGQNGDGHNYVKQAEKYGAAAIISEREVDTSLPQIIVESSRKAMSVIAAEFYGNAHKKLKLIAVTGTNGKTTTCQILKKIFDDAKIECGVIGTIGTRYKDKFIEPTLTTPDPLTLHKIFADMVNLGVKVAVMEASAHALYLSKLEGIVFDVAVFTNFTQDHLDFFKDMESYKLAKKKLFSEKMCKIAVVNSDDPMGIEILNERKKAISYGINNPADVFAIDIEETEGSTAYILNLFDCVFTVKSNLCGIFNVYNEMAAATAAALLGVKPTEAVKTIEGVTGVDGRLEKIYSGKFTVFLDYAHTPDGLEKVLRSLKNICSGRLICVFGCGGNRDKDKRAKMGKISGEIADFTVITSDNPRFEDPMEIISEIEKGILSVNKNYVLVQDRVEAIEYALNYANENDTILIAGKGAEKYQEILGIKHVYNDKDTVKELILSKGIL